MQKYSKEVSFVCTCLVIHLWTVRITVKTTEKWPLNGFVPGDGTAVIDRLGGTYFGEIWKGIIIYTVLIVDRQ